MTVPCAIPTSKHSAARTELLDRLRALPGVLAVEELTGGTIRVRVLDRLSAEAERVYDLEAEFEERYPDAGFDVWVSQA